LKKYRKERNLRLDANFTQFRIHETTHPLALPLDRIITTYDKAHVTL
jgi:hypothetical protein